MTLVSSQPLHKLPAYRWGALCLFAAVAAILIALGFQHLGGVQPCALCFQQRYAYYAGIPLLFGALVVLGSGHSKPAGLLFLLVSLMFLANAALGVYHAGAEWKLWPGPEACTAAASTPASAPGAGTTLLERLKNVKVVRCDEPSGRFLGLSFAGWNVFLSIALVIGLLNAAFSTKEN